MSITVGRYKESLDELAEKYPTMPKFIILKIDVQRRGVHYSQRALAAIDESVHQLRSSTLFGSRDSKLTPVPESLILRDGTTILTDTAPLVNNPYLVDVVDEKLVLVDNGEVRETVEYWTKPDFFDKLTSAGTPMKYVLNARPQRIEVMPSSYCHFWDNGKGCRFCDIVNHLKHQKDELGVPSKLKPQDVSEAIGEAIKEQGRYLGICLTAGSNTLGKEAFDKEVDYYIEILQAIGENFSTKKFPSQLIATAFTEKQLAKLYENTGLTSYTADIEVLSEQIFDWVCPGKAEWIGYQEWKKRLIRAVDIFGRGQVNTGLVGGVELAKPHGFATEDDALKYSLEEAEDLATHGVSAVQCVWVPRPQSYFSDQHNPSLEYYIRLSLGLHNLRVKYNLAVDFDNYRRCGNHPDTDLSRLL